MLNRGMNRLKSISDEIDRLEMEKNEWKRKYYELRNEIAQKVAELQNDAR